MRSLLTSLSLALHVVSAFCLSGLSGMPNRKGMSSAYWMSVEEEYVYHEYMEI